ncbi:MAG TPA: hypothetical protein VKZ79_07645 [Alphaproteobacteria bacterium]|nr:hypothetical protein [Alphaproteobacteria bacterium]
MMTLLTEPSTFITPDGWTTGPRFVELTADLLRWLPVADRLGGPASVVSDDLVRRFAARPGFGFALLDSGYIVGAGGVMELWPGRGLVWMTPGIHAEWRHFRRALAHARRWLGALQASGRFRRLECTVDACDQAAYRWAHHLGFVLEARLRAYAPDGSDHFLLVRFKDA